MKMVLISPYEYESFGVRTLHSSIKENKHEVHSIFLKKAFLDDYKAPSQKEFELLINKILEIKPNLIGISLNSIFFQLAKQLTKLIKKSINLPIIWGGVHPTIAPEECIKETDYICIGEGEYPILELLNALSKNSSTDNIENIWVNKNGKIIKNDVRNFINLEEIPFPDWSNDNKYYINNNQFEKRDLTNKNTYLIMSSRGCPFDCAYCCNHALKEIHKGKGNYVRRISVDRVIEELKKAKKTFPKLNLIKFKDDVFTIDKKWVLEFAEEYKKYINISLSVLVHPRFCDREIIDVLKKVGLRSLRIGIQSGSERILKDVFKRFQTNNDVISAFKIFKRNKIHPHCDIILDNPFETEQDKIDTFNLLFKLPRPFTLYFFSLTYFPYTELTDYAIKEGKITEDDFEQKRQKALYNWRMHFNLQKEKGNKFYYTLYALTQMPIPRIILKIISKNKFLKRHPKLITPLKYTRIFKFIKYGLNSLFSGDISVIKRTFKVLR